MRHLACAIVVLAAAAPSAQSPWALQPAPTKERLRAVSAASDKVAWASGNKGTVLRTTDGGATWLALTVPDASMLDFRDIEAFDAKTAYVLSIGSGSLSRIYKTADGGRTWAAQFVNQDPRAFFDALAFWDKDHGLAAGDPVDGRATVIRTSDGGRTWLAVPADRLPAALPGEGAFAASGTCLATWGRTHAWFGTGGAGRARVLRTNDGGDTWQAAETGVTAGNASSGIFSLAFVDAVDGIAVGGDYRQEAATGDNVQVTTDGGATWTFPGATRLRAFRSAVSYVPGSHGRILLAAGPSGSDRSDDHGRTWLPLGDEGFHALSIEPRGRAAWAVGDAGRIARYRIQ